MAAEPVPAGEGFDFTLGSGSEHSDGSDSCTGGTAGQEMSHGGA